METASHLSLLGQSANIVLPVDRYLAMLVAQYGSWIYAILFLIVFCETGLVVMPFLPGDSLLFVAGALAAAGGMSIATLIAVLFSAAVLGDNTNYWIGRAFGQRSAALWVILLTLAGYWFGALPWIKSNLSLIIVGIATLSLLQVALVWLRQRLTGAMA